MKKLVNSLWKIWQVLLFAGPVALFFSYYPSISLGSSDTMNFEFSLAEIWLILFAVISLINLKNLLIFYGRKLFLLLSFPAYTALSLLWTPNRLRALLTVGLLFLLIFAALNFYYYIKTHREKLPLLQKILVLSAVLFSAFCWLQCILDLLGVARSATLLCRGCTYLSFGYPHPNGFAIEPQFAGNLLLAPALLMVYGLIAKKPLIKKPWQLLLTLFLVATIFLTFSRGAIYALCLGLGLIFLLQFPVIKYNKKKSNNTTIKNKRLTFNPRALLIIPITLGSFLFILCIQGLFAELSPTSDTFWTGVSKSIHQLSLGKIDFRPAETSEAPAITYAEAEASTEPTDSVYSGYVEQSSAFRSQLTKDALDIWNDSPRNLLFGTGLGSAGIELLKKDPDLGIEKEIVQNEYASILLELGLVGFLLAAITIIYIIKCIRPDLLLSSVLVAFAFTLFFFGGLPNALHVYLFPILLANPLVQRPSRHK